MEEDGREEDSIPTGDKGGLAGSQEGVCYLTSEEDICKFLKEAVKDEVSATTEYRDWMDKIGKKREPGDMHTAFAIVTLRGIAEEQEQHAIMLANVKEALCPGDDPDFSDLSEKAKAKLKEIWEAAKKRTKYEAELTRECRLGAMAESKKAYDEFMKKCMVEKKLAPPPR
jgi:hypothetical protein